MFGFVVLSVSITLISLIVIWDQIKQMQHKTETLDFVLFGPKREVSGTSMLVISSCTFAIYVIHIFVFADLIRLSEHRALAYTLYRNETDKYLRKLKLEFTANESLEAYQHSKKNYSLVCYYVIPSRSSIGDQLRPSDIDPTMCSHIIVFFASVDDNSCINFTDKRVSFHTSSLYYGL